MKNEYATLEVRVHKVVELPVNAKLGDLCAEWGMDIGMQESFYVVTYDAGQNLRRVTDIARGSYHDVLVSVPTVITAVAMSGTDRFKIVHNHPSGDVTPSETDYKLTQTIMAAANAAGQYFEDHVIVGPGGAYHSMTEHGEIVPAYPKGGSQIAKAGTRVVAKIKPAAMKFIHE